MKSVQQKIASGRLRDCKQMPGGDLHLARRLVGATTTLMCRDEPALLHGARGSRSRAAR